MARRMNGSAYEFVGLRDGGDGIVGLRDKIIVKDELGQRHEFYLGDEQAEPILAELGILLKDIIGLSYGRAQGKLSFLYHLNRAQSLADQGNVLATDQELKLAETGARLADTIPDPNKLQAIEELREKAHSREAYQTNSFQ